jgi:hypothetical protein
MGANTDTDVKAYPWTPGQQAKVDNRPVISGKFAVEKGLWDGRKVAVYFMRERGNLRNRTDMRFMYGTLVLTPNAPERKDQIGLRQADGSVYVIHMNRVKDIYDMTRTKATK